MTYHVRHEYFKYLRSEAIFWVKLKELSHHARTVIGDNREDVDAVMKAVQVLNASDNSNGILPLSSKGFYALISLDNPSQTLDEDCTK